MARRAVHPGTPFNQVITSKFVNELTRTPSPSTFVNSTGFDNPDVRVYGQIKEPDKTVIIEPYEVVLIREPTQVFNTNDPDLPQETLGMPTVYVDKLSDYNSITHGWLPHWGIAQGLITAGQAAQVLITGTSFLKHAGTIPTTNLSTYRGIDVVNGVMVYNLFGRAELIGNLVSGESHCLVHLTRRLRTSVFGRTVNSIAPSSSGLFNLGVPSGGYWSFTSPQLTCYNPHDTKTIAANRRIIANEIDGRWVVVFEACP